MEIKCKHSALLNQIKLRQKETGVTNADLARALNRNRNTVSKMLSGNTLSVCRLQQLSVILNYNFFQFIANQFSLSNPPVPQAEELAELQAENRALLKILKLAKD